MNHISNYTNKTTVKTLIKVVSVLAIFSGTALAADPTPSSSSSTPSADTSSVLASLLLRNNDDACQRAQTTVSNAVKDIGSACRKAGLGGVSKCIESSISCGSTMGSDVFSTTAQALAQNSSNQNVQLAGAVLGQSEAKNSCPQMSGRDYWSEKDKITKDIDSTQKELADLNDDKAKVQDDFNKQIQDLQDDLNKAQEELDKQKLDMKDKKRKQLADFQTSQNQAKEELRKKSSDVLSLRGQLIKSQQDQALQLIAMTDASGKRACMRAVNDAKKAYDAIATNGSGNYIAKARQKKDDLINTYNDCMDSFAQQRNALNKSKKQEQDQINKAITDAQQSSDEISNGLNTAQEQLTEMQNDAQTEEDNATQKVVKLMQTNQNKMLAAQQKMQTNLQTLTTKNQSLTEKLNRLNNSLMTLGAAPKSRSSDYSPEDASSDISSSVDTALTTMDNFNNSTDTAKKACFKKGYEETRQTLEGYREGVK